MSKKKVVIIGGGNGSAISVRAIKQFKEDFEISAVVSMSDSAGSTGRLREEFGTLPPGDIMRAILSMSEHDFDFLKTIFYRKRFVNTGKLDNHNLGNLFLVLSEQYGSDYMASVRALEQALDTVGHVYPITLDKTDLIAELDNGDIVRTEGSIDRPEYDCSLKIKKTWLEPGGAIFDQARQVIVDADHILLGPGSLYTSVVATLLPQGVKEAIDESKAKLIFVAGNGYEKDGETGPEKLSEFVNQLESYLPRKVDFTVFNNHEFGEEEKRRYEDRNWGVIEADKENLSGREIIFFDYEKDGGGLNPGKLGLALKGLLI